MDPVTIGALAVAAATTAYKVYKKYEASNSPSPRPRMSAVDRLKQMQDAQPTAGGGPIATAMPAMTGAPSLSPASPVGAVSSPVGPVGAPMAASPVGAAGSQVSPLERLRKLQQQGGGF